MQVLDSDASTASRGSPPENPNTVSHLRHQLSEAQKEVDQLLRVIHRLEVEMTTAEARCQMPEFWLVSCLTPLCAYKYVISFFIMYFSIYFYYVFFFFIM